MRNRGFTLLELLFVLVVVALLAGIVGPMLTGSISRARETALKEDLRVLRKAIDDYYADNNKYPPELAELADKRYLRGAIPADPVTERRDSWITVRAESERGTGGIIDVHSGSDLAASDGTFYRDW
jgi:general secretion pathway protein G